MTAEMFGSLKRWLHVKTWHFLGTVQEPYYTWLNALANAWILFRNPERVVHLGTLHPDKTFYVIRDLSPNVGLAGWYDRVLGYVLRARKQGWIPVVDPQAPAQEDDGDWYAFFVGVSPYSVDEVMKSRNVVFAVEQGMIHKRYSRQNIARRHPLCMEFGLSHEARAFVDERLASLFRDCPEGMVGIRYRGTDYRYALGHARVPDVELFCDMVERDMARWGLQVGRGERIFAVTEEQEALDAIRRRFPDCRFVEKERFKNFKPGKDICRRRLASLTPKMNNFMYLLEIHALAQCDYLIGGVNGGVLMALNLNGNRYKGVHVLDTGVN